MNEDWKEMRTLLVLELKFTKQKEFTCEFEVQVIMGTYGFKVL